MITPNPNAIHSSAQLGTLKEVLLQISTRLAGMMTEQIDGEINNALRTVGQFMQVDRACVDEFSKHGTEFRLTHMWEADGSATFRPDEVALPDRMPWYTSRILNSQPVIYSDPDELPAEAEAERKNSEGRGIASTAIVPMVVGGEVIGSFGLNTIGQARTWSDEDIDGLKLFSQIIAGAIGRQRNERRNAEHLRFEAMIADLVMPFVKTSCEEVDSWITKGLQRVGEFLNVERVVLVGFDEDGVHLRTRCHWAANGFPLDDFVQSVHVEKHFPIVTRYAIECKPLVVPNTEDFPHDAVHERDYCRMAGIKSLLIIPVALQGRQRLALAIDAMRAPRQWPAELVEQLKILAEVFTNALLRAENETKLTEAYARIEQLSVQLESDNAYLREEINTQFSREGIVGQCEGIRRALSQVEQVAPTDSTVLILGETGTGKELMARAIHLRSTRKDRPLVMVNCAALSASLIESELFGREKGAYTGALTKQAGRFEIADGATIFLDEVGELGPELQTKFLRVLQTGQFERLGSPQTRHTDVRVVAATNRDLRQAVRDGTFREDLYYRLNVFPLTMPPLRERREDIPLLVWTFVRELASAMGKTIDTIPRKSMQALQRYAWPGNIRELRNVIERSVIITAKDVLQVELPDEDEGWNLGLSLEEVERQHIMRVLEQTDWRVKGTGGAAEILDINPSTLLSRMRKLGIQRSK
ncbi:MAG: sigma 54-interacting transcriptional regulator [Aeoliella sp.]